MFLNGTTGTTHPRLLTWWWCRRRNDFLNYGDGDCGDTITLWWWWYIHIHIHIYWHIYFEFAWTSYIYSSCYVLLLRLTYVDTITIVLLTIHVHAPIPVLLNNEMDIPHVLHVLSHAGYYHVLLQSLRYFLENFYDRAALYWTPLAKLSRESAFTCWYRLRFRPQTPSSRTISALNSANVDCFPFAMLNRVSCVNETTLLSRVNLCHWYIRSHSTEPIPADPLVNYSQSP